MATAPVAPAGQRCRRRRSDAERNRQALLAATRALIAEAGLSFPLDKIAERAGLGVGTLYRHFPSREELVEEALLQQMTAYLEAVTAAVREPDPWAGLLRLLEAVGTLQAGDCGLRELFSVRFSRGAEVERLRRRSDRLIRGLITRAAADRRLSPQVCTQDLLVLVVASAAVVRATTPDAPDAWRRFLALQIEGLRSRPDSAPLPDPPPARALTRAMSRQGNAAGCLAPPPRGTAQHA